MEHVSTLLQGHWPLLQQFNRFLPDGHRLELLTPALQAYSACHKSEAVAKPEADELASVFFARLQARRRTACAARAAVRARARACPQERFKDDQAKLNVILRALVELPMDGDGFTETSAKPSTVVLEQVRPILQTKEHSDLWKEFQQYIPQSWLGAGYVLCCQSPDAAPKPSPPEEPAEEAAGGS